MVISFSPERSPSSMHTTRRRLPVPTPLDPQAGRPDTGAMTNERVRMLRGGSVATERRAAMVTIDMDGVLSEPLLGMNVTARGPVSPPEGAHAPSRLKGWLWPAESVRYFGRRSMPGAEAFLRELAPHYRLVLV